MIESGTEDVAVVLPGFLLQGKGFIRRCGLHEHITTYYLRAPWKNWRRRHVAPVIDFVEERVRPATLRHLFLCGISDAGVVLFDCGLGLGCVLMAYAATWLCPDVEGINAFFVCGNNDKLMRRHAESGAAACNEKVFWVPGGHRWNSDYNETFLDILRGRAQHGSTA